MSSGMHTAYFRFYEELNDFLPPEQRKLTLSYSFRGHPGIKDPIESLGVPHTEVELIIVDGESVGSDYQLRDGDRVAVYPMFESLDVSPLLRLRNAPLRRTAFVVDVNPGRLARNLRMCGFDTVYRNDYRDRDVAQIAVQERRIVLTRDRRLLHHKAIIHGYWVRATDPEKQLTEVLERLDLRNQLRPFRRCLDCNGAVESVDKDGVSDELKPLTRRYYDDFHRCRHCGKIYWEGSHYEHMTRRLESMFGAGSRQPSWTARRRRARPQRPPRRLPARARDAAEGRHPRGGYLCILLRARAGNADRADDAAVVQQ